MELLCSFVLLILGMSAAVCQEGAEQRADPTPRYEFEDLTGNMLVFPQETSISHFRTFVRSQNLAAVTVCMRYFTDLTRDFSFFSASTRSFSDEFLIYKMPARDEINVRVKNKDTVFKGLDYQMNKWQSLCATWDGASGVVQLWIDGNPSTIKFAVNSIISDNMIIVIGQDQDTNGSGFDQTQSFVGMISDVHMWNYVLSPYEINNYSQKLTFPAGNVLNWKAMEFQIVDRVLIQKEQNKYE